MVQTFSQLRLDLASALAEFLEPEEAQAESVRWFEEGLGRARSWMAAHGGEPVSREERHAISDWIHRRRGGRALGLHPGLVLVSGTPLQGDTRDSHPPS